MKTYFEPTMSISAFDSADVITTSGGFDKISTDSSASGNSFKSITYNDLNSLVDAETFGADSKIN